MACALQKAMFTDESQLAIQRHSEEAMKLARSMRRTRRKQQKRKTGKVICHHLRMMLAEELPTARQVRESAVNQRHTVVADVTPATATEADRRQFALQI